MKHFRDICKSCFEIVDGSSSTWAGFSKQNVNKENRKRMFKQNKHS